MATGIALTNAQRDTILRVTARYGARNVRVFGSVVSGKATPESDIDILVDMEPGRSLVDLIAIEQDLEDELRVHVDVLTAAGLSPYMRGQVLREAVVL
ncbi:MAG: nucleotidyltransferase family protein [Candidatus Hydrogenedentes bacterium]|nr:nucleotidyltransferase family protein [Candidatus Hydrogenedentota bacterium]